MILGFERRQAVVYIMRAVCAFFCCCGEDFPHFNPDCYFGVVRKYHANKKIQVIQYEALDWSQTTWFCRLKL